MRRTTTAQQRTLALAVAVVLLAGCGSGDGDDAAPSPAGEETTTVGDGGSTAAPDDTGVPDDGTETPTANDDDAAAEVVVTITDFAYDVASTVPPGSEVTVTNADGVGHTVTSDDELFDVAVDPGATVTFTAPDESGEYGFHCIPHPHMTATLVVG